MSEKFNFSKGIQYMIIATFAFAIMGALIKQVNFINVVQIVFFRASITALICTVTLKSKGLSLIGNNQKRLLFRSLIGMISMTLFFITLQRIPFGASVTLRYLSPFFSIVLAVWLLKEKANLIQWLLFVLAIVGVFLLKGFDTRIDNLSLIYSLLSASLAAGVYIIIKKIGTTEHPLVIVNYFMGFTTLISGSLLFFFWEPISLPILGILFLVGITGYFGQKFMTSSLQQESIVNVAPFKYFELVFAFILGFIFFGESYNLVSVLGISLIIFSFVANFVITQRRKV